MVFGKLFQHTSLAWEPQESETCHDVICRSPWNESSSVYYGNILNETYFWLECVVQCVIAGIGLIGNIFTIFVFTSPSLRSNFHAYLTALACFDLGYTFTVLVHEALQMHDLLSAGRCYIDPEYTPNNTWLMLYPQVLYPFLGVFAFASQYFTVIISLDRYVAVTHPLYYYVHSKRPIQNTHTIIIPSSKNSNGKDNLPEKTIHIDIKKLLLYVLMVLIVSILYCVPLFLEYEAKTNNTENPATNFHKLKETKLKRSSKYILIYYVITDIIFRFILPISVLLYTNYGIYKAIKISTKLSNKTKSLGKAQHVMLFGVVGLLIICHSYRFSVNIYQYLITEDMACCGMNFANIIAHMVGHILITFNSSANCFIYIATSKKFLEVAVKQKKSGILNIKRIFQKICSFPRSVITYIGFPPVNKWNISFVGTQKRKMVIGLCNETTNESTNVQGIVYKRRITI